MTQQQKNNKEILQRMKRLAEQSEQTTIDTNAELARQGQQLDRIQDTTNQMDKATDRTKLLSRQIYSFWYYLKDKVRGKYKENEATSTDAEKKQNQTQVKKQTIANNGSNKANNLNAQKVDKEEETEEDALQAMSQKMKSVIRMQKEMGNQIDRHNNQIDKITDKTEKINNKINESNNMLKRKL